jgi:hypothetical protein
VFFIKTSVLQIGFSHLLSINIGNENQEVCLRISLNLVTEQLALEPKNIQPFGIRVYMTISL